MCRGSWLKRFGISFWKNSDESTFAIRAGTDACGRISVTAIKAVGWFFVDLAFRNSESGGLFFEVKTIYLYLIIDVNGRA